MQELFSIIFSFFIIIALCILGNILLDKDPRESFHNTEIIDHAANQIKKLRYGSGWNLENKIAK